MGSVQLEFDLETYVDADYAHKAEMADGVKKALYVRGILAFLMSSLGSMSIGVYEDNKRAMDLAKKPLGSSNSKHIDVRHHIPREMAASGDISVQYLWSEDQHADILTKAIGRESFERHRDFLLGRG